MIDASVLVNAVAATGDAGDSARSILQRDRTFAAPAHVRIEATSALRIMVARNLLDPAGATTGLARLLAMPLVLHPFEPHAPRVWALQDNVVPCDAWYVALAEALETTLVTADARLAAAPGARCPIEMVA